MSAAAPLVPPRRRKWLIRGTLTVAVAILLSLGGAVSLSQPFQRGMTRLFGKVVDGVKDHPRTTVGIALGSVAALWLAIGAVVAGQELQTRRGRK